MSGRQSSSKIKTSTKPQKNSIKTGEKKAIRGWKKNPGEYITEGYKILRALNLGLLGIGVSSEVFSKYKEYIGVVIDAYRELPQGEMKEYILSDVIKNGTIPYLFWTSKTAVWPEQFVPTQLLREHLDKGLLMTSEHAKAKVFLAKIASIGKDTALKFLKVITTIQKTPVIPRKIIYKILSFTKK